MTDAVACFALGRRARVIAVAKRASQFQQPLTITSCSGPVGVSDLRSHAQATRSSSATASLIRRIAPIMHRRLALGRCSATDADSSRPGRASGPSLCSPGGAPGVPLAPFAGLLPRTGGGSFLIGPGPPACSSSRRAPIDFRRVDSPLFQTEEKHESRHCAADHVRLDWLLGFDSRLRSVSPSVPAASCDRRACGIVPALGLSSFRHAGTRCAFVRARPRSNHQVANAL
jgi:hypothetical protein